jgi:hypothetical protein
VFFLVFYDLLLNFVRPVGLLVRKTVVLLHVLIQLVVVNGSMKLSDFLQNLLFLIHQRSFEVFLEVFEHSFVQGVLVECIDFVQPNLGQIPLNGPFLPPLPQLLQPANNVHLHVVLVVFLFLYLPFGFFFVFQVISLFNLDQHLLVQKLRLFSLLPPLLDQSYSIFDFVAFVDVWALDKFGIVLSLHQFYGGIEAHFGFNFVFLFIQDQFLYLGLTFSY